MKLIHAQPVLLELTQMHPIKTESNAHQATYLLALQTVALNVQLEPTLIQLTKTVSHVQMATYQLMELIHAHLVLQVPIQIPTIKTV